MWMGVVVVDGGVGERGKRRSELLLVVRLVLLLLLLLRLPLPLVFLGLELG